MYLPNNMSIYIYIHIHIYIYIYMRHFDSYMVGEKKTCKGATYENTHDKWQLDSYMVRT